MRRRAIKIVINYRSVNIHDDAHRRQMNAVIWELNMVSRQNILNSNFELAVHQMASTL